MRSMPAPAARSAERSLRGNTGLKRGIYNDYQMILDSDDVDTVYVGLINSVHYNPKPMKNMKI